MGERLFTDKLVFGWLEGVGAWSLDSATRVTSAFPTHASRLLSCASALCILLLVTGCGKTSSSIVSYSVARNTNLLLVQENAGAMNMFHWKLGYGDRAIKVIIAEWDSDYPPDVVAIQRKKDVLEIGVRAQGIEATKQDFELTKWPDYDPNQRIKRVKLTIEPAAPNE